MSRFRWSSGVCTHRGNVRERNEDAALDGGDSGLWVVADGMGGHDRGDLASRLLIERLADVPGSGSLDDYILQISDAADEVNRELLDQEHGDNVSGTTMVALSVAQGNCACVWIGDSRAYRCRDGSIKQVTEDHTEEQGSSVLTRAIGAGDYLELDVRNVALSDGDLFVLCTDGLYSELSDQEIAELLMSSKTPQQAARRLVESARQGTCNDNVTALVVEFEAQNG
jgi:serine/threonine protein phosphatase PrpC